MEIVGAFVPEVTKRMSIFLFRKISSLLSLHANIKSLQSELEKLIRRKNDLEEDIRLALTEGKDPTSQAIDWIKKIEEIECDVQLMLEDPGNASIYGSNLDCCMHYRLLLLQTVKKKCEEVKQLLIASCTLQITVFDRKPPIKPMENMTAPSLAGQKATEEMLEELMRCLNDGGIKRIAVWGMGGIRKTTLDLDLDLRRVQSRIAERLNLEFDVGESTEGRAMKLHETLMTIKFLLILDDVWEKLGLDVVGIPQESAGDVVELEVINPLARAIAIKTMGSSMRNKIMIELWENVLCQLQRSILHDSCMLEQGEGTGTIRMHGVARDVAIWNLKETGFSCQAGTSVFVRPQKLQKSLTMVSFMNYNITRLPSQLLRCSRLTVLLLQVPPLGDLCELQVLDLSGLWHKSTRTALERGLDVVDCLSLESDWLKRLRKFNIRVNKRSCDSNYLPTRHDEKRVILRGVDLMSGGLEGLLCNANALDLVTCGGINKLSEVFVRNNLFGLSGLKSLTISRCDCITSLINGETILKSMLPNLEHIRVGECRRIKRLIAETASNAELPKLKVIEVWDLANLRSVCIRTVHLPVLERIGVRNCPLLVKLPITAYNAAAIKEIRGELEWWNYITWQDYEIKSLVQRRFQACTVPTTQLRKEERWLTK
ncbi:unnamed protein product [Dovyalis caffra]|uniref:NB-ARC domain-containing protein n=1 Tax=Dovyalis caffra TaxID=77055 RepID=A0AAV1RNU4_9ROSI|nr:unnamed protein product [Dovyalis caffra]